MSIATMLQSMQTATLLTVQRMQERNREYASVDVTGRIVKDHDGMVRASTVDRDIDEMASMLAVVVNGYPEGTRKLMQGYLQRHADAGVDFAGSVLTRMEIRSRPDALRAEDV